MDHPRSDPERDNGDIEKAQPVTVMRDEPATFNPDATPGGQTACPVCDDQRLDYMFIVRGLPVARCPGCGLVSLGRQRAVAASGRFAAAPQEPELMVADSQSEQEAAGRYLNRLAQRGLSAGRLLVLCASPGHAFLEAARGRGYEVTPAAMGDAGTLAAAEESFDGVVVLHQLERCAAPGQALADIYAMLKPGGLLFMTAPSIEAWPAKFFKSQWTEYHAENRFYFSPNTLQLLLLKAGFAKIERSGDRRIYTLAHIHRRARAAPQNLFTRGARMAYRLLPPLRKAKFRVTSSAMILSAVKAQKRRRPVVSIIVPVYNERDTFKTLMDSLLARTVAGVDREILVVESNSCDGTRELAREYETHAEVRVILQEKPRGKGNAVREGFFAARGDILMIQDADLEYDLNDYDQLLEPLVAHRELFILGARHGGSWKMRRFTDQANMATMLNFGHLFFTGLMNRLFHQSMKDPFTMYKVFWRDCLHGLKFECNRFDFDHELVIKLCLKGYRPLELPVNYVSRSFKEGKKVSIFREPPRWIRINFKLWWCGLKKSRKGTPAINPDV